jgi:hypothetical protein
MKTQTLVIGLVVLIAVIAIVYVLSQPRGTTYTGTLGTGAGAGGAAGTFAGIWGGLGQAGTSIAMAAES